MLENINKIYLLIPNDIKYNKHNIKYIIHKNKMSCDWSLYISVRQFSSCVSEVALGPIIEKDLKQVSKVWLHEAFIRIK